LKKHRIGIVICDCDSEPDSWREMLADLAALPDPPLLIVTSRLADERLWAEALNLGAWDVLAKPWDREEVKRTLDSAWLHWPGRHGGALSLLHLVHQGARRGAGRVPCESSKPLDSLDLAAPLGS
jgi:response regulator RpfG family c-di-GMP phosphodiesterase